MASLGTVNALQFNFELPLYEAGHTLGGSGKPDGAKWSGSETSLAITGSAGVDGSQALVLERPAGSSAGSNFVPSESDLPDFDSSSSIIKLDFAVRFVETPLTNTSENVGYLQFGSNGSSPAARITFYSDGTIGYHVNNSNPVKVASNVFQITNTTTWYEFSLLLDYSTKTYSVAVDGSVITTLGVFRGSSHDATLRFLTFGNDSHRQIAFDNLSVLVVPEPSTALLFGCVAIGGVLLRSRKKHAIS